jgi:hypothetical protein
MTVRHVLEYAGGTFGKVGGRRLSPGGTGLTVVAEGRASGTLGEVERGIE